MELFSEIIWHCLCSTCSPWRSSISVPTLFTTRYLDTGTRSRESTGTASVQNSCKPLCNTRRGRGLFSLGFSLPWVNYPLLKLGCFNLCKLGKINHGPWVLVLLRLSGVTVLSKTAALESWHSIVLQKHCRRKENWQEVPDLTSL